VPRHESLLEALANRLPPFSLDRASCHTAMQSFSSRRPDSYNFLSFDPRRADARRHSHFSLPDKAPPPQVPSKGLEVVECLSRCGIIRASRISPLPVSLFTVFAFFRCLTVRAVRFRSWLVPKARVRRYQPMSLCFFAPFRVQSSKDPVLILV